MKLFDLEFQSDSLIVIQIREKCSSILRWHQMVEVCHSVSWNLPLEIISGQIQGLYCMIGIRSRIKSRKLPREVVATNIPAKMVEKERKKEELNQLII